MIRSLFSVIIPTKDRWPGLKNTLNNLKKQTDGFFEVIIIDSSENDIRNQVNRWIKKNNPFFNLRFIKSKANPAYQRNVGYEHSFGEFLIFLDDDGEIKSDYLLKIRDHFKNDDIDGGQAVIEGEDQCSLFNKIVSSIFLLRGWGFGKGGKVKISGEFQFSKSVNKVTRTKCLSAGASFFRKKVFDYCLIDEKLKYPRAASDFEFSYRASKKFNFKIFPDIIFYHKSSGSKKNIRNKTSNNIYSYNKIFFRHFNNWWRFPFYIWAHLGYLIKFIFKSVLNLNFNYLIGWLDGWKKFIKDKVVEIIFIGSFPPPFTGVGVLNKYVKNSYLREKHRIAFLDITDRRNLNNLGALEFGNIMLGLKHFLKLLLYLFLYWPKSVFLTISFNRWGFIRDSLFIVLARIFRRKVIVRCSGHEQFLDFYNQETNFIKRYIKFIFRSISILITQSKENKKALEDWIGNGFKNKIELAASGIDLRLFDRLEQGIEKKNQIIFVAPTKYQKGIDRLVGVAKMLKKDYPKWRFLILGEYQNKWGKKITKAKKRGELSNLLLVGEQNESKKAKLLLESKIFCLPSEKETFSLATAEAMAAGLPLVLTDFGGTLMAKMKKNKNYLLSLENGRDLKTKLTKLIGNKKLREKMGKENRIFIKKNFTRSKFIKDLDKIFNKV